MGNSIGGKKRTAKVMKVDGTAFRLKPPVQVADVLRDHPGFNMLDAEEVKQLGVRTSPLSPDINLKAGKLYFLVELPKLPNKRAPRRAWSGQLQVGAKERLESLMLTRRSTSDISTLQTASSIDEESDSGDGAVRLRMKLPKKEVERLMEECKDPREAAQKIMELCKAAGTPVGTPMTTPARSPLRSPMMTPVMTPKRSPLRSALVTPVKTPTRAPDRWPSFTRTPELRTPERWPSLTRTPDLRMPRTPEGKEKKARFVALPEEITS